MTTLPRARLARVAIPALLLALACVPPTKIVSNRSEKANANRKRILVRSNLNNSRSGATFGPKFAEAFDKRLGELLKACGAEVQVVEVTGVELDANAEFVTALAAFKPDTVMTIVKTHGTVPAGGGAVLLAGTFTMDLWDASQQADPAQHFAKGGGFPAIWRSTVEFPRGAGVISIELRGMAIAEDVTNRMKQDGFFPGCAQFVPPKERYE